MYYLYLRTNLVRAKLNAIDCNLNGAGLNELGSNVVIRYNNVTNRARKQSHDSLNENVSSNLNMSYDKFISSLLVYHVDNDCCSWTYIRPIIFCLKMLSESFQK